MTDAVRKHPVTVEGFDGTVEELARRVCSMRYDKVAEFFGHVGTELDRQKVGDRKRNRPKLANLLLAASGQAFEIQEHFLGIFELCKPHMKDEL